MLSSLARVTRTVGVNSSLEVTVSEVPSAFFWCELDSPTSAVDPVDESPRRNTPYVFRYGNGYLKPTKKIDSAAWIEIEAVVYEVMGHPRMLRNKSFSYGYEAQLLPITELYPYKCALVPKGTAVSPPQNIPAALWLPTEDTRDHGGYVSYSGYVPVNYQDLIDINTEMLIGTKRFTVTRETHDRSSGIVSLTLRGSGRG